MAHSQTPHRILWISNAYRYRRPRSFSKGTLAARLARHFNVPYLDTGLLYRAVGLALIERGASLSDSIAAVEAARTLNLDDLDSEKLRGKDMGEAASVVSALPELRAALFDLQRCFAEQPGGAVLDGRDIGTVICPEAPAKFFITADPEIRAARRSAELRRRGEIADLSVVLADIRRRDACDSSRSDAPLAAAVDAHLIDTTDISADETFAAAMAFLPQSALAY